MFNFMHKHARKALTACLLAASAVAAPAMATVISFSPSAATVTIGGNVAVDVRIAGLASGADLGAFDMNVLFNAGVLNLTGYTLGAALGEVASVEAFDLGLGNNGSGVFNLAEVSLLTELSTQLDAFTLATLYFSGVAAGNSTLSLGGVVLGDAFGNLLDASFGSATVDTVAAAATVPEPQTLLLLLTGLLLADLARRQRKQ